jgi:hypothetical protein
MVAQLIILGKLGEGIDLAGYAMNIYFQSLPEVKK